MTGFTALPLVFSASQVETYAGCPRKWGWNHIAGIKPPQADSAKVGDCSHKQLEGYLDGAPIDFTQVVHGTRIGDVVASGTHLLPAPKSPGMQIETSFRFTSPATGFTYVGRKDIEADDGAIFPLVEGEPNVPHGSPVVSDHKTTSGIKWAKTPADLNWDVQANLYAFERLSLHCNEHDDCRENDKLALECAAERQKRTFRFLPAFEPARADAVDLVWTYYQTKGAKKSKRVHLRVTRDHAEKAFRGIERIAQGMAEAHRAAALTDDKQAFVRTLPAVPAQCGKYGGCPYQANCQLTISERFSAQMSDGNDFFASLEAFAAKDDSAPSVMGCSDKDVPEVTEIPASFLVFNPINPPEANLPPLPAPPTAAAPVEQPAEEPKKRGRGRPAGSKNKKTETETPAELSAPSQEVDALADTVREPKTKGFTLYVDCIPDGVDLTYADDLIAQANARIVKESGEVAHYSFLPYGKGRGALAIALEQILNEQAHDDVFCTSTSDALPTLTVHAARRIRSVR